MTGAPPRAGRELTDLSIRFSDALVQAVVHCHRLGPDSPVTRRANADAFEAFRVLTDHLGDVELRARRDLLLVNQFLVHVRGLGGKAAVDGLLRVLRQLGVGSIILSRWLDPDGLAFLVERLARCAGDPGPDLLDWLMAEVGVHQTETMDVIAASAFEEIVADRFEVGEDTRDDVVLRLYCHLLSLARHVHGWPLPPGEDLDRELDKAVGRLASLASTHRDAVLACASLWLPADYLPLHAVNRTFLATALGQRAGLDERSLGVLADAALHADAGMSKVPQELRERGALDDEAWSRIRVHPQRGAWLAISRGGRDACVRARCTVALEHHVGLDGGGYPDLGRRPHLFSRIVSVADVYDALCSERGDRDALPPARALRALQGPDTPGLDESLVQAFAAMLGPYPPGTPVILDTGEVGVVRRPSADQAHPDKPVVYVVGDPEEWYRSSSEVDLLTDPDGGQVAGMPFPDEVPFNPAAVYFQPENLYEG